jgi:ABC-type multidrug transport system permease subunit
LNTLRVVAVLGRRSILQTFRRPQLAAPLLIFPTLLLAIQSAGVGRAIEIPGFPEVDSFLQFLLPAAMVQSAMFGGNAAGIALAVDIEMGFTDRLLASPIPRFSIVAGRLAGTSALGFLTALWFLAIGLAFGVPFEEGVPGVLLMVLLVTMSAFAFGTIGAALALRTGSASIVQGTFPLVFVILFLSTAFFPENLLVEPAKSVAKYNPLSFIVDAVRDPVISSFSAGDLLLGLGGIALVGGFGAFLCVRALRHRVAAG